MHLERDLDASQQAAKASKAKIGRPKRPQYRNHTFFFSTATSCLLSTSISSTSPYISNPLLARKTLDGFQSASSTRFSFGTSLSTSTMAETAAPVKTQASAAESQARPTRPDEKAFNEALAKAEKDHKASMDRLVRFRP